VNRAWLCIYDLARGAERLVLATERHIEAPNWHPSGALLVNGEGRLFQVPLDAPALKPVDTGHHDGLNNDHGISPDGRLLAISDKTETGKSCIHIRPWAGGPFRRVTPAVPSWWHGWSPDGATIVYAAARDGGPVHIRALSLAGGPEWLVTDAFDHADGPDFSADGQWIWFNGERDGAVDLWRVRPDGRDLQRMTEDAAVNWFPHPSPDGAHVVYLAYPPGTTGHPGGLPVELRLMPQTGGPSRALVAFLGGQGSINVPSWAPDGQAFAYVRYDAPPG
jgi:Tol biopolymer transport system component